MLVNKRTFRVITGTVLCLLLVVVSTIVITNAFGSTNQSTSAAGTNAASSSSSITYKSPQKSSLTADPANVAEADNFSQTFTLTLDSGSFLDGINKSDITLDQDFSSLTIESVRRTSITSITVTIRGSLIKKTGTGSITVLSTGTDTGNDVTASVTVNSAGASAIDLVDLNVNEGVDGAGAELINNFMGSIYNYDNQAAEDVEAVKVTATTAPGTDVKILMDDNEKADGVVQLSK